MRAAATLTLAVLLVGGLGAASVGGSPAPLREPPGAQVPSGALGCVGPRSSAGVPVRPAPPLRFGINPNVTTGQVGPPAPAVAMSWPSTLAALRRLRVSGRPFVLRLTRLFWSDGEAGIRHQAALARRYGAAGFSIEVQLRYHPLPEEVGHLAAWDRFVRSAVDQLGAVPAVTALQVTNEVNFTASPDSSDGAYPGARAALVQGVEVAKAEARRDGYGRLRVGFNWFYRTDPADEQRFWGYLRDHGGPTFSAAVDWVGLDAYPGTAFPPAEPSVGGYGEAMVNALGVLRRCFMPYAHLGHRVAIRVTENGWPTGPGRTEAKQAQVLAEMVRTVNTYRGTFGVTDYQWFDLRDANSSSPNPQQRYGLLDDHDRPKPAFGVYRRLVAGLSGP